MATIDKFVPVLNHDVQLGDCVEIDLYYHLCVQVDSRRQVFIEMSPWNR